MATNSVSISVSDNTERISLHVSDGDVERSLSSTVSGTSPPVTTSTNTARQPIGITNNDISRAVSQELRNPYYVGARAYVEQTEDGATITIIDKEGTTTATVHNGTSGDYDDLTDKPQIEGVTLVGNKTYEELNLNAITNSEIEELQL